MRIREQIVKIYVKVNNKDEEEAKKDLLEETKHFDICDLNVMLDNIKQDIKKKNIQLDKEEEQHEDDEYNRILSSACCEVADIQNIIFGPTTSRFWLFRKHMNTFSPEMFQDEKAIPFLAWQCITLQLKHRDVDLVIKNQVEMDHLLKFLIYEINTVNGQKDSGL